LDWDRDVRGLRNSPVLDHRPDSGLPLPVIERAKVILAQLESDEVAVTLPAPGARPRKRLDVAPADDSQLSLL
jgi:DNA mismatch repair protein MutS